MKKQVTINWQEYPKANYAIISHITGNHFLVEKYEESNKKYLDFVEFKALNTNDTETRIVPRAEIVIVSKSE